MKYYIIPIFIPHYGCPHTCIFCNQKKITGLTTPVTPATVEKIIAGHLKKIPPARKVEIAFYGGSFTALPLTLQKELLAPAATAVRNKYASAIRLSTRPDCVTLPGLEEIAQMGVSIIELGVQSFDNAVLKRAERGHTREDAWQAVKIVKSLGLQCGIQLMPGLPRETRASLLKTARTAIALQPDFARIYPTLVICATKLAELYKTKLYQPLTMDEAIFRSAILKLLLEKNGIPVIRIGLQATQELQNPEVLLAGPFHPAFGELVDSFIFYLMILRCLENIFPLPAGEIIIHHHPKDTSKVRGISNWVAKKIKQRFPLKSISYVADGLKRNELHIINEQIKYIINKSMLFFI